MMSSQEKGKQCQACGGELPSYSTVKLKAEQLPLSLFKEYEVLFYADKHTFLLISYSLS